MTATLHLWTGAAWVCVVLLGRYSIYDWGFWCVFVIMCSVTLVAARVLHQHDKTYEQLKEIVFGRTK